MKDIDDPGRWLEKEEYIIGATKQVEIFVASEDSNVLSMDFSSTLRVFITYTRCDDTHTFIDVPVEGYRLGTIRDMLIIIIARSAEMFIPVVQFRLYIAQPAILGVQIGERTYSLQKVKVFDFSSTA